MLAIARTIATYSAFLWQSIKRDIHKKYQRSMLGHLWSLLNPLLMMLVLTLIFSHMLRHDIEHYSLFVLAGMLPWSFFSETVQGCLRSFTGNAGLLGQVRAPKYLFILSLAFSNVYSVLLMLIPFSLIAIGQGRSLSWTLLLIPLHLVPLFMITVAASLFLATLNVFFQDVEHLTRVAMRALYFACPVMYPPDLLPAQTRALLEYNPLFTIITSFREILYFGIPPNPITLALTWLLAVATLSVAYHFFLRLERQIPYHF
jgi:ABC-2 type transport system permease protein